MNALVPIARAAFVLTPGDVVLYRFPHKDATAGKTRTCLVVDISRDTSGPMRVMLAYGGDGKKRANRGFDLMVSRPSSMEAAGLHKPTRFTLARFRWASIGDPEFDLNPKHGSPRIGSLDPDLKQHMQVLRRQMLMYPERVAFCQISPKFRERLKKKAGSDDPAMLAWERLDQGVREEMARNIRGY